MHPNLTIRLPRAGQEGAALPYWELVRKHGRSRKSMVEFICKIYGGFWDHTRFAISFNVKAYNTDLDADHLWKLLLSDKMDVGPESSWTPEQLVQARHVFDTVYAENKDKLWEWGTEEAYEGWSDSDSPYETFAGERIEWSWELRGRCGGHLCMVNCEGIDLRCTEDDLYERLMREGDGDRWDIDHASIRALFIICVQNTVDLTPKKVSEEVEYRAAWRLWTSFCEEAVDEALDLYKRRADLSQEAGDILSLCEREQSGTDYTYVETFKAICQLAGIKLGE